MPFIARFSARLCQDERVARIEYTLPGPGPPPGVVDGWTTAPPDFVGLGVQRCGTTRWYDLICDHPQVVGTPSIRKELHYFLPSWTHDPDPRELERYASYFPRPRGK